MWSGSGLTTQRFKAWVLRDPFRCIFPNVMTAEGAANSSGAYRQRISYGWSEGEKASHFRDAVGRRSECRNVSLFNLWTTIRVV